MKQLFNNEKQWCVRECLTFIPVFLFITLHLLLFILFIHGVFNITVSSSHYVSSDDRMINE
jgi:hypothetical protein